MPTLNLNLKKRWFDMIKSGEKKEEYRDISDYWARRLGFFDINYLLFDQAHFKNGYARNGQAAPCFDIAITGLRVGPGKPEWGAEPGNEYFVLGLGDILAQAAKDG